MKKDKLFKGEKQCKFCEYIWLPRVAQPKKCPRCLAWQDEENQFYGKNN